jgi:hypothetical protein
MPGVTISIGALVFVFINFAKAVINKDHNAWLTQLIVWAAGFLAVVLFAHSQFGVGLSIGGTLLRKTSCADQVLLGLLLGSVGSTANEFKKAFDNHDTAATHALFPAIANPPPVPVPAATVTKVVNTPVPH